MFGLLHFLCCVHHVYGSDAAHSAPQAYTTHSTHKLNLRTGIVALPWRRIGHSSAKANYCAVLPGGGRCGLTLGPKICLAGNIATHTPDHGVCYGGWPKQGWGHPPLAFEHMGLLSCASERTYIQHCHAQKQNSYITPAFSGVPDIGEQNQKWLPHPYLLSAPKEGGSATSPLRSRGSPTQGDGNKIGPQKGGSATSPLRSRGSPNKGTNSKVAHKWSELCYVTPMFSGVPEKVFKSGPRRAPRKNPIVGVLKGGPNKHWS